MNISAIAILSIIGLTCLVPGIILTLTQLNPRYVIHPLVICGVSIIFIAAIVTAMSKNSSTMNTTEKPGRQNYTVYLDGQEVDSDKIDLSLYKVKYDDDKQIAYATHNDNDTLVAVFLGYFLGTQTK